MIVCCTNNTRDAQFGLFVCVCVSLFLVSASSDLGPMFKVSFSAFLRCECSSSRPLDTFSFILNALADCIVRKGTMLEEWKNGAIRISFVYFTISRELCQCVSSTQQLLFVGTRIGNAICSSIYLSDCLSVRLSVCVASQLWRRLKQLHQHLHYRHH